MRTAASLFCFVLFYILAAQAAHSRKLTLSGYREVGGGIPKKRHGRDSDGDAGIEVASVYKRFFTGSLGSPAVWRIERVEKLGLRPP